MPCRDYMDDDRGTTALAEMKKRCDMLSRIACKALEHIESANDGLEVLVLKDPEIQQWWSAHKAADKRARQIAEAKAAERAEKDRLAKVKQDLLARMSEDEKKALGLK